MSEKEKKKLIESMSEQFVGLDEIDKVYITGYVAGKQEERQKITSRNLNERDTNRKLTTEYRAGKEIREKWT